MARGGKLAAAGVLALVLLSALAGYVAAENYYKVLGVARDATTREIKKAYRKLALELHPDKLGPDATAKDEEKFIAVAKAYEVLSDPESRRKYDLHGEDDPGGHSGPIVVRNYADAAFDFYAKWSAGSFEFHYKEPPTPTMNPTRVLAHVTLEQVLTGTSMVIPVSRQRFCGHCQGSGADAPEHIESCPVCQGSGYRLYLKEGEGGYEHGVKGRCNNCDGTGRVAKVTCHVCNGSRIHRETHGLNVTVPPGAPSGHTIEFAGKGNQALHFAPGAIEATVIVAPHPRFQVEGANLVYHAKILLIDALLGFNKTLVTLLGERIEVKHETVTFTGFRLPFPGYGLPVLGNDTETGTLFVEFEVLFPTRLSERQRLVLMDLMNEDELAILEDVIRLAAATEAAKANQLSSEEAVRTSVCGVDPFVCIPDPVWSVIYDWFPPVHDE